jgi:hypothetical protein
MAHFARIENNLVTEVLVVPDEQEHRGEEFLREDLGLGGNWIQTSYNRRIRKNYAGVGFTYDEERDAFIPPQPFPSWILDEETCNWVSPVPYPTEPGRWNWNETEQRWE